MRTDYQDVVICAVAGWGLVCFILLTYFLHSLKKERSMPSQRSKFDKSIIDQPAYKKFVKDKLRVYVITNTAQGKTVRTTGFTFPEALTRMGWEEKDVMAVDLGPTSKPRLIVEYKAVQIAGDFPRSDGREVGKE